MYWRKQEKITAILVLFVALCSWSTITPSTEKMSQFLLSFRTRPDHTIIEFVPGIGITRYVYVHHGTVAEADVKLIEYYPGEVINF